MTEERIIKIFDNRIYLSEKDCIDFSHTNFPSRSDFQFNQRKPIFWRVKGFFDKKEQVLTLEVINYTEVNIEGFKSQSLSSPIDIINFQNFDWEQLELQLTSYKEIAFKDLLIQKPKNENATTSETLRDDYSNHEDINVSESVIIKSEEHESPQSSFNSHRTKEEPLTIQFHTRVKIKDLAFVDGGVLLRTIQILSKSERVTYTIRNSNIVGAINHVKYFLYKILKTKHINVKGKAIYQHNKLVRLEEIHSHEIDSINENIIDQLKYVQIEELPKLIKKQSPESSVLLKQEELSAAFSDEFQNSTLLAESPQEIIETLISQNPRNRNKKQLMFLSGKLQNDANSILYTLKPEFGFIFNILGNNRYHYCWELLNSHATYIWSFDKKVNETKRLEAMEVSVNIILAQGRRYYKNAFKQGLLEKDFDFQLITHPKIKDSGLDRFTVWKSKLFKILD